MCGQLGVQLVMPSINTESIIKQGVTIIGIDYKDESPKAVKWLKDFRQSL